MSAADNMLLTLYIADTHTSAVTHHVPLSSFLLHSHRKPFLEFLDLKERMDGVSDRIVEVWSPFITFGPRLNTPMRLPSAAEHGPTVLS